jgi:predicted O-linked N-acetylglucosamine transferase (SPINDLY family)/Flp pilus assembly protein TadD
MSFTVPPVAEIQSLLQLARESLGMALAEPTNGEALRDFDEKRNALSHALRCAAALREDTDLFLEVEGFLSEVYLGGGANLYTSQKAQLSGVEAARSVGAMCSALLTDHPWNWAAAPSFDRVPFAAWGLYARATFWSPLVWESSTEKENYLAHLAARLSELAKTAEANRGSLAVRAAMNACLDVVSLETLLHARSTSSRLFKCWSRIVGALTLSSRPVPAFAFDRMGRKLKVGVIASNFGLDADLYQCLPLFEELDREHFEVVLLPLQGTGSDLETHLAKRVLNFEVLLPTLEEQVQQLQVLNLDVAVLLLGSSVPGKAVHMLAKARFAPVQIGLSALGVATGASQIDLYLSRVVGETGGGGEKFLDIGDSIHTVSFGSGEPDPLALGGREDFGWTETDLVVGISGAPAALAADVCGRLNVLLHNVPELRVLLQPIEDSLANSLGSSLLQERVRKMLTQAGIDPARVAILPSVAPASADRRAVLALTDVILESTACSQLQPVVDAVLQGVPALTAAQSTASGLLRILGLSPLAVDNDDTCSTLLAIWAKDRTQLEKVKKTVSAAVAEPSLAFDSLAASHVFGLQLERVFQFLVDHPRGLSSFRAAVFELPIKEATESLFNEAAARFAAGDLLGAEKAYGELLARSPREPRALHGYGRALLQLGRAERASAFLLEGVHVLPNSEELWCDLADALHQAGRLKQATEALQACLNLNARNIDAILLLGRIAEFSGQLAELEDVVSSARLEHPDDPRVDALSRKVIAAKLG